ncbi:hypothetical protein [Silvanigrella sp.]|jgi:predicted Rossmann-fold nucleotide-binding protein|uniref:hypothetical protein n=1 Tax=Silvanigrella sp. TaxID=2024976 RepID=UPI0037C63665
MIFLTQPSIGIVCSSKIEVPKPLTDFAFEFGILLGKLQFKVIFNENNSGLIEALKSGVINTKGEFSSLNKDLSKTKKSQYIYENSDIICFLPGSLDTLSEFIKFININKNSNNKKTIIIVDILNYFSNLLNWFEEISLINMTDSPAEMFCIARSISDLETFLT